MGQFSEACRQKEQSIEEDNDDEAILQPFLYWHKEYCEAVLVSFYLKYHCLLLIITIKATIAYRQHIAENYENACKTTSKRDQKLSKLRSKEQNIESIAFAASDLSEAKQREAGIKKELEELSTSFQLKGMPSFQRIVEAEWKCIHQRLSKSSNVESDDSKQVSGYPLESRVGGLVI